MTKASYKRHVIEAIFDERWDARKRKPSRPKVEMAEVVQYITEYNHSHGMHHSTRNPANFFKDFVRKCASANRNWPPSVFDRGYTGQQLVGGQNVFEFVPTREGQAEPFPGEAIPPPPDKREAHVVESISMPIESRQLGRRDEAWLTQVAVRLRLIETHFATASPLPVHHIEHLQMNVKMRKSEVDSLYLGTEVLSSGRLRQFLIACEAKVSDDILLSQLVQQAKTVLARPGVVLETLVPLALKVVGPSLVQIVEFEPVTKKGSRTLTTLSVAVNALYRFHPGIEGLR